MNEVTVEQAVAAVRQIALVAGGWAIGRGYLQQDTLTALITIAGLAVPFIWGQSKTRKLAKK
ncbi:Pam3-gp28 family putative phage holin [Sphingobium sp. EP60837]|uniref:Pam3-gp28 family putative phage holin n=1 Tax=Sphingobium sp. EP60837 TaxID=1855519 RepID=UPI0007DD83D9|nr:hypothetical protein [Sphingobium sp. EP60837]ANI78997.1 hypothetical protein EP837_02602 [Sphingobium sp. EP60837]